MRGFTLIEVLIALAIVSIALAAVMRSVAVATDDQSRLRDRRLALMCAQDRWQELRLAGQPPQNARQRCVQGRSSSWCCSISAQGVTDSRNWNSAWWPKMHRGNRWRGCSCRGRRRNEAYRSRFTLIEVMIAIAIMGVLALICWRALDSVASSDQRLRRADAETTTALRVLQQFQRDIEMRADDELMNGAVRPADQPQRLLPPSLVSERHPDGSFALEITRSLGSDGLRWQRVRWWRQGSTLWRASGAATDRYPCPHRISQGDRGGAGCAAIRGTRLAAGRGWALLPSKGEVLPATGLELRLGLRDGRGPLSYRRVLELRIPSRQASTHGVDLLPSPLWWVPTLVGTEAYQAIHAWRGSYLLPIWHLGCREPGVGDRVDPGLATEK